MKKAQTPPSLPPRRIDGRWLLALLALALMVFLVWGLRSPDRYEAAWDRLGIYSLRPPFFDLVCLLAAADSQEAGYDPLVSNPYDPQGRPILYPRLWVQLASAIPPGSRLFVLGPLMAGVFLASLLLFLPRLSLKEGFILAPLVFSPPLLLGVERGNNDLVVFVLLAFILLLGRTRWPFRGGAYLLVLLASLLKFYPLLAVSMALKEGWRKAVPIVLLLGGIFLAYAFAIRDDIATISRHLYPVVGYSYGVTVAPQWFKLGEPGSLDKGRFLVEGLILFAPLLAFSWWMARRTREAPPLDEPRLDGLRVGSALFLGTWMMGSNFDYRLIVLIPALPALAGLALSRGKFANLSRAALALLFLFFWSPAVTSRVFDHHVSWLDLPRAGIGCLLAAFFAWALLVSLPPGVGRWVGVTLPGPGPEVGSPPRSPTPFLGFSRVRPPPGPGNG